MNKFFPCSYENPDGTLREEESEQSGAVHGRYSYKLDGVLYTVTYTSDSNGFKAEGDHLPKPIVVPPPSVVQESIAAGVERFRPNERSLPLLPLPSFPSTVQENLNVGSESVVSSDSVPHRFVTHIKDILAVSI